MSNLHSIKRLAGVLLVFVASCTTNLAQPHFLTLPFSDPDVFLRQGWVYDSPVEIKSLDAPPNFEYLLHKGIDYFLVKDDKVQTFDVVSAAPGRAVVAESKRFGYFVFIRHDEVDSQGLHIFTLYAHLEKDSWTAPVKTIEKINEDIKNSTFADWKDVKRGVKIGNAGTTGTEQIHLHFEVHRGGYVLNKTDPYNIYGSRDSYSSPCEPSSLLPATYLAKQFQSSLWTECPPVYAPTSIIFQPGPGVGKDIWTTSIYSYTPAGGRPGGGLDDHELRVGGWGDFYYSLLQFDLTNLPQTARSVRLELYPYVQSGYGTTGIYVDRVTQFWDWKTQGNGSDRLRLWWADRPASTPLLPQALPGPIVGTWFSVDITELYNGWQSGAVANFGVQLRPAANNNQWAQFYSSDYIDDPQLRPRLVIEAQ